MGVAGLNSNNDAIQSYVIYNLPHSYGKFKRLHFFFFCQNCAAIKTFVLTRFLK